MIPIIYLLVLIAWVGLFAGFAMKDFTISSLSSFFLMVLGVYVAIYGMSDTNDFATQTLGIIQIVTGFYVIVRGAWEIYKDA